MSCLTIFADQYPDKIVRQTRDAGEIATLLAPINVQFERWTSPVEPPENASQDEILALFRPYLDALMGATGAGSADVISMTPEHPQAGTLREKFLAEHTHTEDEIRFFVRGGGNFVIHADGKVFDVHCAANDLIDAGDAPFFTALRVFSETGGWVPHFTGERLDRQFPASK
jgi:1,2-dihydroxy-3-keto-5-methylthiopentene dioxygenase